MKKIAIQCLNKKYEEDMKIDMIDKWLNWQIPPL